MSFLAFRGIIRGGGSVDMSASYPGGQTPSSSLGEPGHAAFPKWDLAQILDSSRN